MDNNLNILLQILFGGTTAWLGAKFSHGRKLGIWGFALGALAGLIGGLLFLTLSNPADTIGSIIAAMFVALFAIFILRLAESNNIIFGPLSQQSRSQPEPVAYEEHQEDMGIFNFFSDDDKSEQEPKLVPPNATPLQTAPSDTAPIGYDSEMFGTGVNSLQGQSLFDTDDEIPNLPREMELYAKRDREESRPEEFTPPAPEPESAAPAQNAKSNEPLNDPPRGLPNEEEPPEQPASPAVPEEPYSFIEDDNVQDKTVFTDLRFDESGMSELGTVEDVYGANYAFDASPGIPEPDEAPESAERSTPLKPVRDEHPVPDETRPTLVEPINPVEENPAQNAVQQGLDESTTLPKRNDEPEPQQREPQTNDAPFVEDAVPSKIVASTTSSSTTSSSTTSSSTIEMDSPVKEIELPFSDAPSPEESLPNAPSSEESLPDAPSSEESLPDAPSPEESLPDVPSSDVLAAADAPQTALQADIVYAYPDDLTKIKGIGKVYAQRLNQMGIFTWSQVADTEPPLLKDWVAATQTANVKEWPQLARSLAVAYDRVGATYSGAAPDDLTAVIGITKKLAMLLNKRGIVSYQQLAEADSADLIKYLTPSKVTAAAVYDWIGQAKTKADA